MPGTFSKSNRPKRPGAYFNFIGEDIADVPVATGAIVAVPLVHDWGPVGQTTLCRTYDEFKAVYGDSDTAGQRAVRMAFEGEAITMADGTTRGGAGGVLALRLDGTGSASATVNVANTAGSPVANALALTARYKGTFGNQLRVQRVNNAADSAKDDLVILIGTTEVERFTYTDTDITALAADINANSDWVTAVQNATGTALEVVSTSRAFASGADPTTPLAAGSWTAAQALLETERFGVYAPYLLPPADTGIRASTLAWVQALNAGGHRFLAVIGGAADESASTANSRSTGLNDPNVVNIGVGSARDTRITDPTTGVDRIYSTAELAPRIGGILAASGQSRSATFARLAGLELLNGATQADILSAFDAGTIVLSRDSNAQSPVRIEKSLTTWTTKTNPDKPYLVFRSPKYVQTMHSIENELTEWSESPEGPVGRSLPVNDKTRQFVVGELGARIRAREPDIVQPGSTVKIDTDPPPTDEDEFIQVLYGVKFTRSMEQVFNTVKVS